MGLEEELTIDEDTVWEGFSCMVNPNEFLPLGPNRYLECQDDARRYSCLHWSSQFAQSVFPQIRGNLQTAFEVAHKHGFNYH
jgi:hypothetical protein